MQKHQWRQHGIVHLKSGRMTSSLAPPVEQQQQQQKQENLALSHHPSKTGSTSIIHQDSDPNMEIKTMASKTTASSSSTSPASNDNINNESTSPIKLKMKLAYQQQILLMDQCKIEQEVDKPLDLSCSKSNTNNSITTIIPLHEQKLLQLSDNQPSQLPITITETNTTTTTTTLPFTSKTYTTTITNVPTTTIQMSDATGTLSKLLQNFSTTTTKKSTKNPANNPPMPNQCSKLLLHGLFQSEGTRNI
jgi:hypothetical protein